MGAGGSPGGRPAPFASYRATWYPDQPVSGQGTKLGYLESDFLFSTPLFQTTTDQLSLRTNVRNEAFNTGAVLPDSGRAFPGDLWNVQAGLTYTHRFDNNWVAGGVLNIGSASDKPFRSIDEMTIGGVGFLRVPSGDRNAWLFSLAYSPTGQIAFPIPGVAYFYQPSDRFYANIGLPFQVGYRPTDDVFLDFSYMLLTTVHAGVVYRVTPVSPQLFLHAAFDWKNESYFLANRTDQQERLFYYDKTLSVGARYNFNRHISLDLSCGYAFDRFYFTGRTLSDRHHDRVDVGDGPFASIQLQGRW